MQQQREQKKAGSGPQKQLAREKTDEKQKQGVTELEHSDSKDSASPKNSGSPSPRNE